MNYLAISPLVHLGQKKLRNQTRSYDILLTCPPQTYMVIGQRKEITTPIVLSPISEREEDDHIISPTKCKFPPPKAQGRIEKHLLYKDICIKWCLGCI